MMGSRTAGLSLFSGGDVRRLTRARRRLSATALAPKTTTTISAHCYAKPMVVGYPHPVDDRYPDTSEGCYRNLKLGLERRGWKAVTSAEPPKGSRQKRNVPDLYWTIDERSIDYDRLQDDQVANHFKDIASVATKAGLTRSMGELHWCTSGVSADEVAYFPRSYALDDATARAFFVEDFKRTAAAAVLKTVVEEPAQTAVPIIPRLVELALRVCACWLNELEAHPSKIDLLGAATSVLSDVEWDELLEYSYGTVGHSSTTAEARHRGVRQQTERCSKKKKKKKNATRPPFVRPNSARPASMRSRNEHVRLVPCDDNVPRDDSVLAAGVRSLQELGRRCRIGDGGLQATKPQCRVTESVMRQPALSVQATIVHLRDTSAGIVERLQALWPQWGIDGYKNIWIVKAPEACRGHGIVLRRRLSQILALAERMGGRVVQKYVENPLLWHCDEHTSEDGEPRSPPLDRVKFDLRLWCLFVCNKQRVQTYLYEPCYARLCSEPFSLDEEYLNNPLVHLTNLAVQRRERPPDPRTSKTSSDESLMRTQAALEAQLDGSKGQSLWFTWVRPRISRILAGLSAAVVANASPRVRSFELIGVDIVLDEDATPWLLEANLSPALARRSESQANNIENMLDGVLRRTIDQWLPRGHPGQQQERIIMDGWTFICEHSIPPPLPQYNTRSFDMQVVGTRRLGRELRSFDGNVSRLGAWHKLRRWWRHARALRAMRLLRRTDAQKSIARVARQRARRKATAATRLQTMWHNVISKKQARAVLRSRLHAIILAQSLLRRRHATIRVHRALQQRQMAARVLTAAAHAWYQRHLMAKQIRAINLACCVAKCSLEAATTATSATERFLLSSNTSRRKLDARRWHAAVKLQTHARTRAVWRQAASERYLRHSIAAAIRIQFSVRKHAARRAKYATRLQHAIRVCFCIYRHRTAIQQRAASITLQRHVRQLLRAGICERGLAKLLTLSIHATFARVYTRAKMSKRRAAPKMVARIASRELTLEKFMANIGLDLAEEQETCLNQHPLVAEESVCVATPCDGSTASATRTETVTEPQDPIPYENECQNDPDTEEFLLEVSKVHNRMMSCPKKSSLRWRPKDSKRNKQRRKQAPVPVFTNVLSSHLRKPRRGDTVARKTRLKKSANKIASLYSSETSRVLNSPKASLDKSKEISASSDFVPSFWAGTPRILTFNRRD